MLKKLTLLLGLICMFCCFSACQGTPSSEEPPDTPPGEETFDPTELPFYVEDTDSVMYTYGEEERLRPYWQGNVIYNEQLMIVEKDGKTEGHLLYDALRVVSVRDWSLQTEYVEGVDYIVNGNTITLPEGSSIPVFRDEWSRGENVPAEYPEGNAGTGYEMIGEDHTVMYTETGLIYRNYIHVTYVYDPADVDRTKVASYSGALYGLTQKLENKEPVKMVVFGDSISEGHSSSELWNHEPFSPPYARLVARGLELYGGVQVDYTNISVGGKDSVWAADESQLSQLASLAPDFLIIAFGTNDTMNNLAGNAYRSNIEDIIETAKNVNSECQILLVAPFPSNEKVKSALCHELICQNLQAIADETEYLDVGYVSMYEGCLDMLATKNYYEIAGNNANHPNDFIHRYYAMNILSTIFDFSALAQK